MFFINHTLKHNHKQTFETLKKKLLQICMSKFHWKMFFEEQIDMGHLILRTIFN